jgi:holo-[acyl-carrier protein] synthase
VPASVPLPPAGHLVLGVGIDVVAVDRFALSLQRTPSLARRLFAPAEMVTASGAPRQPASLAGRFAVKEAVAKALGVPRGMEWHDCTVVSEDSGRPVLVTTGTVQAAADALGVALWRLSLSHDGGIAAAVVLALGLPPAPGQNGSGRLAP